MKRWMAILALAIGVALLLGAWGTWQPALAQGGHGEESGQQGEGGEGDAGLAALRGAALYAEFCQACHGPRGEGLGTNPAFAAITFAPEQARQAIVNGVEPAGEAAMPAYGDLLDEEEVNDLLAYLSTWAGDEVPPLPEPNIGELPAQLEGVSGNPAAGAVIYAQFCGGCHGVNGTGRGMPNFPPLSGDPAESVRVAREGHENPVMPAFGQAHGGPLTDAQLGDLQAYLTTWPQQSTTEEASERGYSLLIVIGGVIAILLIGAIYMARAVYR